MTQIENITLMENRLNALRAAADELTAAAEKYMALQADFDLLSEYYGSKEWFRDFDDSNAGKLPAGLRCGVLSEDAVYNLTKAIFENAEAIAKENAKGAELSLENATSGMTAPFHKGAAKYFAEKGITVEAK